MPDCSSLIVSEETGDYIIEYNSLYFEQIQRQDGVCISCINDTWCILYTNYPAAGILIYNRDIIACRNCTD